MRGWCYYWWGIFSSCAVLDCVSFSLCTRFTKSRQPTRDGGMELRPGWPHFRPHHVRPGVSEVCTIWNTVSKNTNSSSVDCSANKGRALSALSRVWLQGSLCEETSANNGWQMLRCVSVGSGQGKCPKDPHIHDHTPLWPWPIAGLMLWWTTTVWTTCTTRQEERGRLGQVWNMWSIRGL